MSSPLDHKPVILCFIQHYLPGYKFGGPIITISNMVNRLGDEYIFKIITLDRDFHENKPYPHVTRSTWTKVGKADVLYVSPDQISLASLRRLLANTHHDLLYFNSFFDPIFTIRTLLLRRLGLLREHPAILAPRGEFSQGALAIKRYKKKPYLIVAKKLGLYKNIVWQASSRYEANDIRTAMGNKAPKIEIAPNLLSIPQGNTQPIWPLKEQNKLKSVFLSRLSPKKNLDYALMILQKVRARLSFTIYGTVEDAGYWQKCRAIIATLPPNITVDYKGPLAHEKVDESLRTYDLFLFPTRGENYGHVILEALSAGLPILISDQTPWRGLEKKGVGWDFPLTSPDLFTRKIEDVAAMDSHTHCEMRRCAWEYAQGILRDDESVEANRHLFRSVTSGYL